MFWVLVAVITLHGLIHLMGVAKGFRLAELAELAMPISRPWAWVWLAAALLLLGAAAALLWWPGVWWLVGAVALGVSQLAIVHSWADAKFGTLPNLILLAGLVYDRVGSLSGP